MNTPYAFDHDLMMQGIAAHKKAASPRAIVDAVLESYAVSFEEFSTHSNLPYIVQRRQVAAYLLRQAGLSFPSIGHHLGGYHHTTVIYGIKKIVRLRGTDKDLDSLVSSIQKRIDSVAR